MQTQQYIAELRTVLNAVTVLSAGSFSLAGKEYAAKRSPLLPLLEECLYQHCYTTRFQGHLMERTPGSGEAGDLTEELQAANTGRPCWDSGWQVEEVLDSGHVAASKNGATRLFWPGQYLTHRAPGSLPKEGERVSISAEVQSITVQSGFFFVFGETVSEFEETYNLIRFYWNITGAGAAALVRSLTGALNRFQVPFQFKCVKQRELFYRLDAAVLYVSKKYYPITAMLVEDVYQQVLPFLEPDTPLFTKKLAPGLALAENSNEDGSFGTSRCRIVAAALWAAHEKGLAGEDERFEELARQFRDRGLLLERPYLNPGSIDGYEFPFGAR